MSDLMPQSTRWKILNLWHCASFSQVKTPQQSLQMRFTFLRRGCHTSTTKGACVSCKTTVLEAGWKLSRDVRLPRDLYDRFDCFEVSQGSILGKSVRVTLKGSISVLLQLVQSGNPSLPLARPSHWLNDERSEPSLKTAGNAVSGFTSAETNQNGAYGFRDEVYS